MWVAFGNLGPDMVGKALKVDSLRCFGNMWFQELEGWEQKGL